jgi:hypothetical protein
LKIQNRLILFSIHFQLPGGVGVRCVGGSEDGVFLQRFQLSAIAHYIQDFQIVVLSDYVTNMNAY